MTTHTVPVVKMAVHYSVPEIWDAEIMLDLQRNAMDIASHQLAASMENQGFQPVSDTKGYWMDRRFPHRCPEPMAWWPFLLVLLGFRKTPRCTPEAILRTYYLEVRAICAAALPEHLKGVLHYIRDEESVLTYEEG